jgi:adenosylcobinamide kinase/adenosylcobinamide-phosphate guanylyltransferase
MDEPAANIASLLVLGGARSGKSRYAQTTAEASRHELCFVATGRAEDEEMAARIARHRADRGQRWVTFEEPLELADLLAAEAAPGRLLLVDCLSFWLANLMFVGRDLEASTDALAATVARLAGPTIFVSNEVGFGVVPDTAMGRTFRDAQGRLNQAMAAQCDRVVLIAAGLPLLLKPAPTPAFSF